jgi:hypothetical protein
MKLLTKEIIKKMPPLYANENKKAEETPVIVKFFSPEGRWTWFVTEASLEKPDGTQKALKDCTEAELDDPANNILMFNYCHSGLGDDCDEWGYVSLKELKEIRTARFKLPIERDMHFGDHMVSEFIKG